MLLTVAAMFHWMTQRALFWNATATLLTHFLSFSALMIAMELFLLQCRYISKPIV